MLKKVYLSLFIATLLFSFNFSSLANAAILTYWYNIEDYTIGYDPIRYIYRYNYGGDGSFTNDESLNYTYYAKDQWYANGAGPYSTIVSTSSIASIKLYTGSYDALVVLHPRLEIKAADTEYIIQEVVGYLFLMEYKSGMLNKPLQKYIFLKEH